MRTATLSLLLGALLGALARSAAAEEPLSRMQAQFGDAVHQLLCAACHGRDGKGDGPFADTLDTPPQI
jgi:cytochrome c553